MRYPLGDEAIATGRIPVVNTAAQSDVCCTSRSVHLGWCWESSPHGGVLAGCVRPDDERRLSSGRQQRVPDLVGSAFTSCGLYPVDGTHVRRVVSG